MVAERKLNCIASQNEEDKTYYGELHLTPKCSLPFQLTEEENWKNSLTFCFILSESTFSLLKASVWRKYSNAVISNTDGTESFTVMPVKRLT